MLGVIRSFAERQAGPDAKLRDRWSPGIDAPAVRGRADSGDIEIDLVELLTDVGGLAADLGKGVGRLHRRDAGPRPRRRLRAVRRLPRGQPVRAAGDRRRRRPAAPAGGAVGASKSYSERLFSYQRIDRLTRDEADRALTAPAAERGRGVRRRRARRDVRRDRRLPLLHPGLRQDRLGPRPALADHGRRRGGRRPRGRGRARGRLLRQPLRARHPRRARLPARDGRRRRRAETRTTRSARSRPPTWPACSARSRSRSRRRATRCSRRGSSTPASAAGSRSRCRTSAATSGPQA